MKQSKFRFKSFFIAVFALFTLFVPLSCSVDHDLNWRQSDCAAYITPGQYKGLSYTVRTPEPVTDGDVEAYVKKVLEENSSVEVVTSGNFMPGDEVRMDFEGKNGETTEIKFSGYITVLGTKGFFDDFIGGISALYGMPVSSQVKLSLTYRDDAGESKAGRTLDFTLAIAGVKRYHNAVLDDAFVKEHGGFESVDDYLASVRASIEASRAENCRRQELEELWKQVLDNSTVVSYPKGAAEEYEAFFEEYFNRGAAKAGLSQKDYSRLFFGVDDEDAAVNAVLIVKQDLALYRIAALEGISVSDSEYSARAASIAEARGISVAQLEAEFTPDQIRKSVLFDKVAQLLKESAVPSDQTVEHSSTAEFVPVPQETAEHPQTAG